VLLKENFFPYAYTNKLYYVLTLHDAMQPRAESERQVEVSVPHAGQLDSQATNVDPKPAQSNQSQQQEEAKQEGRQQEEKEQEETEAKV
jgi:hypothetical protein